MNNSNASAGKPAKSQKKANEPMGGKKLDEGLKVDYELIKELVFGLKASHQDMLERAWKEFKGDPMLFSATLHAMHAGMMKYEVEFIDSKVMSGKAGDNGKK